MYLTVFLKKKNDQRLLYDFVTDWTKLKYL